MKFTTDYEDRFAGIAMKKLAKMPLRDENILCLVFRCSKQTLATWKAEHQEFKQAIEHGMIVSEYKYRELLFSLALLPGNKVNNNLLNLLSANVYGIKPDSEVTVSFEGEAHDPEALMKKKGIPIPKLLTDDLE